MQTSLERVVKGFLEVERIVAKLGTAEVATDPMPLMPAAVAAGQ